MPKIIIELDISQEMLDAGGDRLFAKSFGWTEKIKNNEGKIIDNPISAIDFGKEEIKKFIRGRTLVQLIKEDQEVAKKESINKFKQLDK